MLVRSMTLAVLLGAIGGCQLGPSGDTVRPRDEAQAAQLPPTLARMRQHYADLAHRAISLHPGPDFNDKAQAQTVRARVMGRTGSRPTVDQPTITTASQRRRDRCAGGLIVPLGTPDDQLVIQRARSAQQMPADWREYYLLLLSISGPPGGRRN